MKTPEKSEILALVASLITAREYVITDRNGDCYAIDSVGQAYFDSEESAQARIDHLIESKPDDFGYEVRLAWIDLTVGASPDGSWSYQTGDNSFTGGAYGHPDWAVVTLDADSKPEEVADDILDQIAELQCSHA